MRVVNGTRLCHMDRAAVLDWAEKYRETVIDLGAGDGRFVNHVARQEPESGVIGVDLVAANLRHASRAAPRNALYVVADALSLPEALGGVASRLTIHFPWGSLLRGLLSGDAGLLAGLNMIGGNGASLEIVVNAGALSEADWELEDGSERIAAALCDADIRIQSVELLGPADLRRYPTTWAKRLAFGRDPRAIRISGYLSPIAVPQPPFPLCYSYRLAGVEPASIRICEPFCSVWPGERATSLPRQRGKPTGRRPRCAIKNARPANMS